MGALLGAFDGAIVGALVGALVGAFDGALDGAFDGALDGAFDGAIARWLLVQKRFLIDRSCDSIEVTFAVTSLIFSITDREYRMTFDARYVA